MTTDYKIVVVPDTGVTRSCIECPQCLGLQLLFVIVLEKRSNFAPNLNFELRIPLNRAV